MADPSGRGIEQASGDELMTARTCRWVCRDSGTRGKRGTKGATERLDGQGGREVIVLEGPSCDGWVSTCLAYVQGWVAGQIVPVMMQVPRLMDLLRGWESLMRCFGTCVVVLF